MPLFASSLWPTDASFLVCRSLLQVCLCQCTTGELLLRLGPTFTLAGLTALLVNISYEKAELLSCMHATGCCRPLPQLCPACHCSEMAPPQLRGRLNQLFQIVLTFAIFAAQVRPLLCIAT